MNNTSIPNYIRFQVFKRDKFTCQYCGKSGVELEVDHIEPLAKGGTNDMDNLITACKDCNRAKRDDEGFSKGIITSKESKNRRVQLLMQQSVYNNASDLAWARKQSFNEFVNEAIMKELYQNADE